MLHYNKIKWTPMNKCNYIYVLNEINVHLKFCISMILCICLTAMGNKMNFMSYNFLQIFVKIIFGD